ncbi:protein ZNRD2-like isoform X2 [Ptychodera flava]
MDPDDFQWEPPSEAEMKIIQAKRERTDKISSIMGEYLLKGYKMLGTCCDTCGTILLRDKQQKDYCIACNELDTEHAKDNPVLSSEAARVQAREYSLSTQSTDRTSHYQTLLTPQQEGITTAGATAADVPANMNPAAKPRQSSQQVQQAAAPVNSQSTSRDQQVEEHPALVDNSVAAVKMKLAWANDELSRSKSVAKCIELCALVKSCAEALLALELLKHKSRDVLHQ